MDWNFTNLNNKKTYKERFMFTALKDMFFAVVVL